MGFKPGNKLAGSRKGVPNRRSQEARAILEAANFCPISAMIDMYRTALARFAEEIEKEDAGKSSFIESDAPRYLKIAADAAKDLASYTYPKLKSVEQVKPPNPLEGLSLTEKLDAFKQAVKLLEAEAKGQSGRSAT